MSKSPRRLTTVPTRTRAIGIGEIVSPLLACRKLMIRLLTTYQQLHDSVHARSGQSAPLKLVYTKSEHEACLAWVSSSSFDLGKDGEELMDIDHKAVRAVHVRNTGNAKVGGGGCCQYRCEMGDGRGSQDISQGCPCLLIPGGRARCKIPQCDRRCIRDV